MNSRRIIVIFNHSSGDIPYVLQLYNIYYNNYDIYIYSINVKNNFRFLNSCDLKIKKLKFIPYKRFSFKNPCSILYVKQYIKYIYNKEFHKLDNPIIYYFAVGNDWLSFSFINKMIKKGYNVNLCPINKMIFLNRDNSIRYKIKLVIFQFICQASLKYADLAHSKPCLIYENKLINKITLKLENSIYLNNSFRPKITDNTILLIDTNLKDYKYITNYQSKIFEILDNLISYGFKIHIKVHPRLGPTHGIQRYITYFIPDYIPAEFINVKSYNYVIGINSSSLAFFAKTNSKVGSIIDMFQYNNEQIKQHTKRYLLIHSDNKLKFISDIENLKDYKKVL